MRLLDREVLRPRLAVEGPQIARIVVAALVAWSICRLIDPTSLPVYAVLAPVVAMRDHPFSAFNVSFDRVIGVVGGVLLGIGVVSLLGVSLLSVAVVLTLGLLGGVLVRVGETLNLQAALSGLLVFAYPDPAHFAVTRIWETLVGAVVTVVLSPVLFPPDAAAVYQRRFRAVIDRLGHRLSELLLVVEHAPDYQERIRAVRVATESTVTEAEALPTALASAQRAVRHNPLRLKDRAPLAALAAPTAQTPELARAVRTLMEAVEDFSHRTESGGTWAATGAALHQVLRPIARMLSAGLGPGEAGWLDEGRIDQAATELDRWRTEAPLPVDAILRRPLYQLLRALEAIVEAGPHDELHRGSRQPEDPTGPAHTPH